MSQSYFILNRRGRIVPAKMTNNQCTEPGQKEYFYQMGLVFSGETKLNDNQWIVKHEDIDAMMQNLGHVGSCESMQLRIVKHIVPWLVKQGLPVLAYKCTIKPVDDADANPGIQFVTFKDPSYAHCLALI